MDIPANSGSSGSPIYYISKKNEYKLVGIAAGGYSEDKYLYEMDKENCKESSDKIEDCKFVKNVEKYTKVHNGLGIAIKAKVILDLFKDCFE